MGPDLLSTRPVLQLQRSTHSFATLNILLSKAVSLTAPSKLCYDCKQCFDVDVPPYTHSELISLDVKSIHKTSSISVYIKYKSQDWNKLFESHYFYSFCINHDRTWGSVTIITVFHGTPVNVNRTALYCLFSAYSSAQNLGRHCQACSCKRDSGLVIEWKHVAYCSWRDNTPTISIVTN
jgi:hypothetical protein